MWFLGVLFLKNFSKEDEKERSKKGGCKIFFENISF